MEKNTFNLQGFLKKAFYEDVRGYWVAQGRAQQNCYKCKSDEGVGPQEAWQSCLEEYNTASDKNTWVLDYSSDIEDKESPRLDAKTPSVTKNKTK